VKLTESFTVPAERATVWKFFEDLERVARCVPGVQEVEVLEDGRLRVRMRQKVGFLSATFDMRMKVTGKEAPATLEMASTGRSILGAIGDLRATNRVDFEPADDSSTTVVLTSEVALGGMLGSVGQKVMASKARETAKEFAAALNTQIAAWAGAADGAPPARTAVE
jgi:carbon monoxide dehydrogenase subunit G